MRLELERRVILATIITTHVGYGFFVLDRVMGLYGVALFLFLLFFAGKAIKQLRPATEDWKV